MSIDPSIVPGLVLLAAELLVLAAVGFVVVRVALGQTDDRLALAQGLAVGLALWGVIVNVVIYAIPGLAGALVAWVVTLAIGAGLAWRAPHAIRPQVRVVAGFAVVALALFLIVLAGRQLGAGRDPNIHYRSRRRHPRRRSPPAGTGPGIRGWPCRTTTGLTCWSGFSRQRWGPTRPS